MSADPAAANAVGAGPPLQLLPRSIREPRRPLLAIVIACLLSVPGSLLLAIAVGLIAPDAEVPDFGWLSGRGLFAVAVLAAIIPFAETLILAATTSILLRIVKPGHAILLSSAGWALAHSYKAPMWGLVIFWPFIIFTTLYVVWKQRSLAWGIAMAFVAHGLHNLLPAIPVGFPGLLQS